VIGLLAAGVIIPWVFVSGEILERVYRAVQFNHPGEHDLLRVMNTKDSFLKWLAISAAVIVAPICEEFVFRGLLQTAITEGILRLLDPRRGEPAALAAMQQPVISPTQEMSQAMLLGAPPPPDASLAAANPVTQPSSLPLQYERGAYPRHWAAWIGIILTSALFALVHPLWTTPLIFVLAVGLGYVYERTGKLWVPMTVHATFNMISTITYLLILH
jgi:membrane protease YdiL (CAAX protease family)